MEKDEQLMETLGKDIHMTLAKELLARIQSGDATSSDLNVARQFLKDNDITGIGGEGDPLQLLGDVLPFKAPKRN